MRCVLRRLTSAGTVLFTAAAAASVLGVSVVAMRVLEARLMNERRDKIRSAVEIAYAVVERHARQGERAGRSREQAQRTALEELRALRYGGGDYFFVQEESGRLLMHPYRPDLEGRVNRDLLPGGKPFSQAFTEAATGPAGAGYVAYTWARPGRTEAVRKLSYVKRYAPWGWLVGSGVYLDDLDAAMTADARRVYWAAAFVALLFAGWGVGLSFSMRRARRLELELQQSRKLEAVGQLAAGIAHEINTPIQFIGDNTRFLGAAAADVFALLDRYRDAVPPELAAALADAEEEVDLAYLRDQVPKTVLRTVDGVQRVASIVRAMKEFAHPDGREMVAADVNQAIAAMLEVARNEYKYVADVETDFGELPPATCHAGELNQVFLNVTVNAAHAIADAVKGSGRRGKIRVTTRREGSDVAVAISDTGGGIPAAIRERIFEPFFTTKEVGRGTGQGLAISRSILRRHGGSIRFETRMGEGTTFFIRFPLHGPARRERGRAAAASSA
jgi:signal transduction histidine kinase